MSPYTSVGVNLGTLSTQQDYERDYLLTKEEVENFKRRVNDLASKGLLQPQELEEYNRRVELGECHLRKMAEIIAKRAVSDREIAESDKKIADLSRNHLPQLFYSIFSKNAVPPEERRVIVDTYLSDDFLSVNPLPGGKTYFTIRSMKPVVDYVANNPHVTMLNFRSFKTNVYDIPTLSELLKTSRITAVGLNSGISEESKACLEEAVRIREGALTIFYAP